MYSTVYSFCRLVGWRDAGRYGMSRWVGADGMGCYDMIIVLAMGVMS